MTATSELLDKAMRSRSIKNDTALAKSLGVTPAAISNYRRGVSKPKAAICAKLAAMTGDPLNAVLGAIEAERATDPADRAVWRRFASAAASVLLVPIALCLTLSASTTQAASEIPAHKSASVMIMSLLRRVRKLARARHLARLTHSGACRHEATAVLS